MLNWSSGRNPTEAMQGMEALMATASESIDSEITVTHPCGVTSHCIRIVNRTTRTTGFYMAKISSVCITADQ